MNEPEFKKSFGRRVKELRLKNGLTQEQLAEMIEVGERNLSKIECGNVFVKAKTIAKLVEALKIEPQELFEFSQHQKHEVLKQILIDEINNDNVDVEMLYRIYRSIKY
ncbi:helix-turn-helix transcriptional regulator [bacterium]|nr:helix-turn-helix transcriptional regulator [bacterium]